MNGRNEQGFNTEKISAKHIGKKLISAKHYLVLFKSRFAKGLFHPACQRLFCLVFKIEIQLFCEGLHPAFRRI